MRSGNEDGLGLIMCVKRDFNCRVILQDGSGEAHLYVQDRVFPAALGLSDREWSDLLDLVYKVGQVTYSKSSSIINKVGISLAISVLYLLSLL